TRFNVPRRRRRRRGGLGVHLLDASAAVLRGFGLLCVALIVGLTALAEFLGRSTLWLLCRLGVFFWSWLLPALGRLVVGFASFLWWRLPGLAFAFRRLILLICLAL